MPRKYTSSYRELRNIDGITLRIRGKECTFSLRKELRYRVGSMYDTDIRHAERFAFWRLLLQEKTHALRRAEDRYNDEYARMLVNVPEALSRTGRDLSRDAVQAYTRLQSRVLKARKRLAVIAKEESLVRAICDMFEHKRAVLMKARRHNT